MTSWTALKVDDTSVLGVLFIKECLDVGKEIIWMMLFLGDWRQCLLDGTGRLHF